MTDKLKITHDGRFEATGHEKGLRRFAATLVGIAGAIAFKVLYFQAIITSTIMCIFHNTTHDRQKN